MQCPRCHTRLHRVDTKSGVVFSCPRCRGRASSIYVLKRLGSKRCVQLLWHHVQKSHGTIGAGCPVCERPMVETALSDGSQALTLDVCTGCQIIWFDAGECERFPPPDATDVPLPEEAREALALHALKLDQERNRRDGYQQEGPEELWHMIPALLGLPVEEDAPPLNSLPWLTYGLGVVMVAIFALTMGNLQYYVDQYGMIPAQLWRHDGATFLSSFFLHGGLMHLVGNVYFLLLFGDNVEDDLGRWSYVALLAVSAFIGDLCHILGNPHSTMPSIGASGGISGVITYYALRFPQARLAFLFRYFVYFKWIRIPAFAALLLWFLLQLFYVYLQKTGVSNIAALAHLGGAAAGVAAWLIWCTSGSKQRRWL